MTGAETSDTTPADRPPRGRRVWPVLSGISLVVLLVAAAALWLVHLGHDAEHQLTATRADITLLRTDVRQDRTTLTVPLEQDLTAHADAAHMDSRDPVWRLVAHIPDVGNDLKVAGGLADIASSLAHQVLPPLVTSTDGLRPDSIRLADGSFDLAKISSVGSSVTSALPAISAAQKQLTGLQQRVHLGDLDRARQELGAELGDVATSLRTVDQALSLLPPMLGADGPRHYFLVFQNLAEARGTGGLMGSYGVLTADHGSLALDRSGAGTDLENAATPVTADLGPGYLDTWGQYNPLSSYFVSNLSPDFPDAGQLFAAHAAKQLGVPIDGVIAIDPTTLGALLGPDSITLSDGTKVTGSTVAQVTESDLYNKYGEASPIRKQLLNELVKQAFTEVRTAPGSRVLTALQSSIGTGHVQLWSSHAGEETQLAATDLGGVLPTTPGPFAWVGVNNTGPKTDFWLDRSLTYNTGACPGPGQPQTRDSEIDVTLTDRVPPGQADVVGHDSNDPTAPYGRGHDYVSVYGPVGATFEGATLNGANLGVTATTERGRLVMSVDLLEPDGQPQNLALHFSEPATGAVRFWRPQPLARPETVGGNAFACS